MDTLHLFDTSLVVISHSLSVRCVLRYAQSYFRGVSLSVSKDRPLAPVVWDMQYHPDPPPCGATSGNWEGPLCGTV